MTREEARRIIATWLVSSKGAKGQRGYIEGWFDEEDVEAFRMAIDALNALPTHREESQRTQGVGSVGWIPCSERLPECEQEVLICTETKLVGKDAYIDSIITPAIYEDGTMLEIESMWSWYDIDFDEWDDTEDCGIIPRGWFENRHFNPDEVYNNPVDRKVVAWMPLPEPWKGGK